MPFELDDILSAAGRKAFLADQYARYQVKALAHLHAQFAPAMAILPEKHAVEFIDRAYAHAAYKGLQRTREHLHYLNLCMFWGLSFDTDPQYRTALMRAGWQPDAAQPDMDTDRLRIAVKRRHTLLAADFATPRRIVAAFAELYDRPDAAHDAASGVRLIERAFPAQFAAVPVENWMDLAHVVHRRSAPMGLADVDVTACVGLAALFGADFLDDPRFHWAREALELRDTQHRRDTLAAGVQRYWDALSPETEG